MSSPISALNGEYLDPKNFRLPRRHLECRGIRDQYIRLKFTNFTQAFRCVAGFANHVKVRLVLQ